MIVIVGPGAVGSFLGWTLAAGGADVALLGRPGRRPNGPFALSCVDLGGVSRTVSVTASGDPDAVGEPDLLILAVRMPDLDEAIATVGRWPTTTVVAVENGIGADEAIAAARPEAGLIAGSLTTSVEIAGPTVRRLSRGGIGLAPVRGPVDPAIAALAARLESGGLRVAVHRDAAALRWSKLLANLLGNATAAILDLDPAEVYADRRLFDLELRQIREAVAVVHRLGLRLVALPGADVRFLAAATRLPPAVVRPVLGRIVAAGRGGKDPSLRRHVRAGHGTSEAAWLNGAVDRAARTLGRRAPVNARLAMLVDEVVASPERRAWFRGRPDRLLAEFEMR